MKKITLLFIALTISLISKAQLSENFQNLTEETLIPDGWVDYSGENGIGGTYINWLWGSLEFFDSRPLVFALSATDDNVPVGETYENWLVTHQFTVTAENSLLTFVTQGSIPNSDSYKLGVSVGSQTIHADFTFIETTNTTIVGTTYYNYFIADLSNYIGQNIYIAFVNTLVGGGETGELWLIDDVKMNPDSSSIPDMAINISPNNNAVNVPVIIMPDNIHDEDEDEEQTVKINWDSATTGDTATYYEFHVNYEIDHGDGTVDTISKKLYTFDNHIRLEGMFLNQEYCWYVIAYNEEGKATASPEWCFTTSTEATASVLENTLNNYIVIYPTVVEDSFTIENKSNIALTKLNIIDISGRIVLQKKLNNLVSNSKKINITNVTSGVYFVIIKTETETISKKIIVK